MNHQTADKIRIASEGGTIGILLLIYTELLKQSTQIEMLIRLLMNQ